MSPASFLLAFAFVRERPVIALWAAAQLAVAVAILTAHAVIARQAEERLAVAHASIDLVVGADQPALGLVLSGALNGQVEAEPIAYGAVSFLAGDPQIANAAPIARADSFRGLPILGVDGAYLERFGLRVAGGEMWSEPYQAVLGAGAASTAGLSVGDRFRPNHGVRESGVDHTEVWYQVVGVFDATGTIADRAVITSLETVWRTHGASPVDGPVAAVLVTAAEGGDEREIATRIAEASGLIAAPPLARGGRLAPLVAADLPLPRGYAWLVVSLAGLSVVVALLAPGRERRRDIALLRAMGARQRRVFETVLLEGVLIGAAGAAVGLACGHVLVDILANADSETRALGVTSGDVALAELAIAAGAVIVGAAAALAPALLACRTGIVKTLTE
ncbi:MAG: FtsX-like permease family protein [Caulobacterales bacterium]|nr:FtsX-like permease family protein [Caulobacterales bacterium]